MRSLCRLNPKNAVCERLAQRSTSPIVKGAYADLAKNWLEVADEIQAANNAAKPSPYRQKEEAPYSARTGASNEWWFGCLTGAGRGFQQGRTF